MGCPIDGGDNVKIEEKKLCPRSRVVLWYVLHIEKSTKFQSKRFKR